MTMDCTEARSQMLAARRGELSEEASEAFQEHLASCAECTNADRADTALSSALTKLPKRRAPASLRAKLEPPKREWRRPLRTIGAAAVLALGVAAGTAFVVRSHDASDAMYTEAVNDHLRVLYSEHPIEIESGGIHQVKPWFAGRVDFAPIVPFAGDADFPLKGGSVALFLDRKAATFVFTRRLHTITLFVFRADGLTFPAQHGVRETRGFHVMLWKSGDLGYALTSDVAEADLRDLANRLDTTK
jgi:anti-sigma factor RsiW